MWASKMARIFQNTPRGTPSIKTTDRLWFKPCMTGVGSFHTSQECRNRDMGPSSFTRVNQPDEEGEKRSRPTWPENWKFPEKNYVIHPPQKPDEPRRRAEYHHVRNNVKYSWRKMWYICVLIRGMTVDEAIKQLSFINKKGAVVMKEVLEEAQEIALKEYGFESKGNMFIGACNAEKGLVIKTIRKHARFRFGIVHYVHTHILLTLVEGPPPEVFFTFDHRNVTNKEKLEKYMDGLRRRNIKFTL